LATPSNCGEFLIAFTTKPFAKADGGQVNSLGYGNNVKDWIIRSEASKGSHMPMEIVQRLSDGGSCINNARLKIESDPRENEPKEERLNQPGALGAKCVTHAWWEHSSPRIAEA
jgi:hypothetical protein